MPTFTPQPTNPTTRRHFLAISAGAFLSAAHPLLAQSKSQTKNQPDLTWHDPSDWGVEGRAFNDTAKYYDRLPARAERIVRSS